jgi:hypothetical protein
VITIVRQVSSAIEVPYVLADLVADVSHVVEVVSGRAVRNPVLVAFPMEIGARVAAPIVISTSKPFPALKILGCSVAVSMPSRPCMDGDGDDPYPLPAPLSAYRTPALAAQPERRQLPLPPGSRAASVWVAEAPSVGTRW